MSPLIVARGLITLVLATAAACSGARAPAADPTPGRTTTITSAHYEAPRATRPLMNATPVNDTFGGGTNAGTGTAAPSPPSRLVTDPEIVEVTNEAHEREITMAELAKRKAVDKDVKDYAVMMLSQHRDAENRENVAGRKAKITGAESDLSARVRNETTSTLSTLRNQNGKGFDKAYIDAEVEAHGRFLDQLDTLLLPNVQSTELRTWLPQLRAQVVMHLAKAREIKQKLGS